MKARLSWRPVWVLALGAALLGGARSAGADDAARAPRYPYDPVCSWGRLSDGKGMLKRCLTATEARSLEAVKPAEVPPRGAGDPPGGGDRKDGRQEPAEPRDTAAAPRALAVEVGPVLVDSGTLPEAQKKLGLATDRFLQCVAANGGLSESSGEVRVRFLVRERGRAEGTSVSKRAGVSEAAAKCIADVVDRRFVGFPEAPLMGATLVVKIREP